MEKRIALVTGANRGIGFETCLQLAHLGIHVILTSRDQEKGARAQARLRAEGFEVSYHVLDVTDHEGILRVREFVEGAFGRLDILVNNAGIYIDRQHRLSNVDLEVLRLTMETNTFGPLALTQAFLPLMRKNRYGRIINVSSAMGKISSLSSSDPAYRLSKLMLNALTRMLAGELKGSNILVNAMSPGWVRTDMGGRSAPRTVEQGADTIVWLATLPDGGPQGEYFRDRRRIEW